MTTAQIPNVNVFSSKSDVAYHELRRLILTGALPAGSRLAQYELADNLQMSITPLREAIRKLSSEGLIELDTHKDARVSAISAHEARQLFEVRLALDPAAVELAADRRTDDDIALMRATVVRLRPVTRQWGEDALVAHREFHRALYLASHNDMLIKLLDDLWDKSDRYRRLGLELPAGEEPRTIDLNEHHQILDLVVARDDAAAGALTRRHTQKSLTAAAINSLEDPQQTPRQDTV
jgi:DNA-binding GntR family transcriptional regulator